MEITKILSRATELLPKEYKTFWEETTVTDKVHLLASAALLGIAFAFAALPLTYGLNALWWTSVGVSVVSMAAMPYVVGLFFHTFPPVAVP